MAEAEDKLQVAWSKFEPLVDAVAKAIFSADNVDDTDRALMMIMAASHLVGAAAGMINSPDKPVTDVEGRVDEVLTILQGALRTSANKMH